MMASLTLQRDIHNIYRSETVGMDICRVCVEAYRCGPAQAEPWGMEAA